MTAGKVAAALAVSLDDFVAGPGGSPEQALGLDGDRHCSTAWTRAPRTWKSSVS
jgi:hypothetical protein